jgi:hypothetical protein
MVITLKLAFMFILNKIGDNKISSKGIKQLTTVQWPKLKILHLSNN